MRPISEIIDAEIERTRALRNTSQAPPVPLAPDAVVTPASLSPDEETLMRHNYADQMAKAIGLLGKGAVQGLTLAAEPLRRTDTAFRGTLLTTFGRMPLEKFPQFIEEAVTGKTDITGDEFNRLAWGQNLHDALDTSGLPGTEWLKRFVYPEAYANAKAGLSKESPRFTAGDMLGLGAEAFVSPWALAAGVNVESLAAKGLAGKLAATAIEAPTLPIVWPARKAVAWLSTHETPFSPLLMSVRAPAAAMKGTQVGREYAEALARDSEHLYPSYAARIQEGLSDVLKPHKKWFKKAQDSELFLALYEGQTKNLSPQMRAVYDDIIDRVLVPFAQEMQEQGRKIPGMNRFWNPKADGLAPFTPYVRNRRFSERSIGEKPREKRMQIKVPWRKRDPKTGKPLDLAAIYPGAKLSANNLSAVESISHTLHGLSKHLIFEKRVRVEKTRVQKVRGPLAGLPLFAGDEAAKTGSKQVTTMGWRQEGSLSKYRPWVSGAEAPGAVKPRQNPELRGLPMSQQMYVYKQAHLITGNRASHREILFNQALQSNVQRVVDAMDSAGWSVAQKNRAMGALIGHAANAVDSWVPKTADIAAATMIAHTVQAALGFNLSSALHNFSQLTNTAAVAGVPATLRALARFASMDSEERTVLREARKWAAFKAPFSRFMIDPSWASARGAHAFSDMVMGPFNATENFVRGAAFHAGLEEALRKRGMSVSDFVRLQGTAARGNANWIGTNAVLREARSFAQKQNFVYGIAGRSALMSNPAIRVGMTLQSYGIHQAEWLAQQIQSQGGSFSRWLAINGWAIDMADKTMGMNAESWLGWGFAPPNVMGRGPQVEMAMSLAQMLGAAATDDADAFESASKRARGNVRELFRFFNLEDTSADSALGAPLNAVAMLGMLPIPIAGITRSVKAYNEFKTGIRESGSGETWQYVTPSEVTKSWFSRTHQEYADQQLRQMDMDVRKQVGKVLDKRTRKYLNALSGRSGDEVWAAAQELASPIDLKLRTGYSKGLRGAALFRLGDDQSFWPHTSMIESRLKTLSANAMVPKHLREMEKAGWTLDILHAAYANRAFEELQNGGIRPLREAQR